MTEKELNSIKLGDVVELITSDLQCKIVEVLSTNRGYRFLLKYNEKTSTYVNESTLLNCYKLIKPMEQEVVIKVPTGKVAVQTTDKDGNIIVTFKDKVPVRSKSWEEFCENHPNRQGIKEYLIRDGQVAHTAGIACPRGDLSKAYLATKEDAEGILALIQLIRLHDEWIGDWFPDYNDLSIKKFQIVTNGTDILVRGHFNEQRILDFPTENLAQKFLNCFRELIYKAKRFI